jgi:membrane-associated phospholipid phosphatase
MSKKPYKLYQEGLIKFNWTLVCNLAFFYGAFCQSQDSIPNLNLSTKIYHVSYVSGSIIIAGGLATDYPAIGRIKGKSDITPAEIGALNPDVLNQFDQWGLHQSTSDYLMYSKISDYSQIPMYTVVPALLAFNRKIRKDWLDLLFMYCEGHVITFTIYNYSWFGPTFQDRYRPITYYTNLPLGDRIIGNNRNSAYSGHTASVAYTSFFMAKVYCDYHPDIGGDKYLIYTVALIPPIAMGYLRVRALAHFPSDCLVGLSLGSAVGIILPELHKFKCKGITLGMLNVPGATGLDLGWTIPYIKPSSTETIALK